MSGRHLGRMGLLLGLLFGHPFMGLAETSAPKNPTPAIPIKERVKSKVYQRLTDRREVQVHADLKGKDANGQRLHEFYAGALVRASLKQTSRILTNYEVLKKIIPFVDYAQFNSETGILEIRGGIWKYRLQSWVRFFQRSEKWIEFEIIRGHFLGMKGELIFENRGEKGTLVLLTGKTLGKQWPPALVLEEGAEIVLSVAGRKMRSFIEENKNNAELMRVRPRFEAKKNLKPAKKNEQKEKRIKE